MSVDDGWFCPVYCSLLIWVQYIPHFPIPTLGHNARIASLFSLTLFHLKLIFILPIQIHHPILKPGLLNRLLKVLKRRQKDIIVTKYTPVSASRQFQNQTQTQTQNQIRSSRKHALIMDRHRHIRLNQLYQLDPHLRIHGHHQQWYAGAGDRCPAEVHEHQVDGLPAVAARDLREFGD